MTTTSKLEKLITMADCDRCFASKATQSIIDVLRTDGKTFIFGSTLEEIRQKYPDAEETTVDEFCAWKAQQQRTPISWAATTQSNYHEMLCCLPPEICIDGAFLVGEPSDHDALTGQPRFQAFKFVGDGYFASSRPMTVTEFGAIFGAR